MMNSKFMAFDSPIQRFPQLKPERSRRHKLSPIQSTNVTKMPRIKMTPSTFARQMSMSTEERLVSGHFTHQPRIVERLNSSKTSYPKYSCVPSEQPLFQASPPEIVFQNFQPFETYEVPLVLYNKDKVPRNVKVELSNSIFFEVVSPPDIGRKLAPGLSATFNVLFKPHQNKDYHHTITCQTERERFEVRVRAIGPRAILNFHDEIHCHATVVKHPVERRVTVFNVGNTEAKFKLHTKSPFTVDPPMGTVGVGESVRVTVVFLSRKVGNVIQDLVLSYHTGEEVYISLHGSATEGDVHFDCSQLVIPRTYISMGSHRSVSLVNESKAIIHFKWKSSPVEEEEQEGWETEQQQAENLLGEGDANIALRDAFSIIPKEGEVWPNGTMRFSIIFRPQEAKSYEHTLYCEVTGREYRLPLHIWAEGHGPELEFSCDMLNVGNVFINSKNSYDLILSNKGLIEAPFRLVQTSSGRSRDFHVSPSEGTISPGRTQAIQVTFMLDKLGPFEEHFTVEGYTITLKIRGCVIGPTFQFNVHELNFGDISYGFPEKLTCCMTNTSTVPMSFKLRMIGDGSGPPSVTSHAQITGVNQTAWASQSGREEQLREVNVCPSSGTIRSMGLCDIHVTLCSNTIKTYNLLLVVDVEGVALEVMGLPVRARCIIPSLRLTPTTLLFEPCYLHHPYETSAQLTNSSNLPACYNLVPQECEEQPVILFSSSHPIGIIQAQSNVVIPLQLQVRALGKHEAVAYVGIFGSEEPPLAITLLCTGEGPVVSLSRTEVNFGVIPVLKKVATSLQLQNTAPIPANFQARIVKGSSQLHVEPSSGVVPAEGLGVIKVVAELNDPSLFKEQLIVEIQHGKTYRVPVKGTGEGTTIVCDVPLGPSLDLGTHFCWCRYPFRLTNHGKQYHRLYWTTEGFPSNNRPSFLQSIPIPLLPPQPYGPVFVMEPSLVELKPGEGVNIVLTGSSQTSKFVQETLVCRALIGQQRGLKRIMTVDVACRFEKPILDVSPQELCFCMEKFPETNLVQTFKPLFLRNISHLPLKIELTVVEPFCISQKTENVVCMTFMHLTLAVDGLVELIIGFDPGYQRNKVSWQAEEFLLIHYMEHPQMDSVRLRGMVHFPNLSFSSSSVEFGCILNHTSSQQSISAKNCSPMPVVYHWRFMLDPEDEGARNSEPDRPVNEIFEISPRSGMVKPWETQSMCFTFHGHPNIRSKALALCEVADGPTYEIRLSAEATVVSYELDTVEINLGMTLFDHVAKADIMLRNTGKLGFDFNVWLDWHELQPSELIPGRLLVKPSMGYIEGKAEENLSIYYIPGTHEAFQKTFQLRVAHLEPVEVNLVGEGVFPRIRLDLPRNLDEKKYSSVLEEVKRFLKAEEEEMGHSTSKRSDTLFSQYTPSYEDIMQMEVEKLLVKKNAARVETRVSLGKWHQKTDGFELPEYILDFGYVIYGQVPIHFVKLTNPGPLSVCFTTNQSSLVVSGFNIEPNRVKDLPNYETEILKVKFDPHGSRIHLGQVNTVMHIKLEKGPVVPVRLLAVVVVPALTVSTDAVNFGTVHCGQCRVVTIQLSNNEAVPCQWSVTEKKPKIKVDKHTPLHLRIKALEDQKTLPTVFEMLPSSGILLPEDRVNVQIQFSPTENMLYSKSLVFSVVQNTQKLQLDVQGKGEVPELKFFQTSLEFGPILPLLGGEELEVIVRNPCSFPIEFYSLEFDQKYLEEEKILRMMKGYDAKNMLLLPQREAGESLPSELLDYYQRQKIKEQEDIIRNHSNSKESYFVGEMEDDPVSQAIARHIGLDLPPETIAAESCRGIAIIIHGAPLSGKTQMAVTMAKHYCAACLSIDSVVEEAISYGNSSTALKARELCTKVGQMQAEHPSLDATQRDNVLSMEVPEKPKSHSRQDSTSQPQKTFSSTSTKKRYNASQLPAASQPEPIGRAPSNLNASGDQGLSRYLLPEELLVEILAERLQLKDCHGGVVIDGLESIYCNSITSAAQAILKAFNNRHFIYVIDLCNSFEAFKAGGRGAKETSQGDSEDQNNQDLPVSEKLLMSRFQLYEQSHDSVAYLLRHWDRTQCLLVQPQPPNATQEPDDGGTVSDRQAPTSRKGHSAKKEREKVRPRADSNPPMSPVCSVPRPEAEEEAWQGGVPHIILHVRGREQIKDMDILHSAKLPTLQEVLDGLGPHIPPPVTYSLVPYPEERSTPTERPALDLFTFLTPAAVEELSEDKRSGEASVDTMSSHSLDKDEGLVPTPEKTKKGESGRESQKGMRKATGRKSTKLSESPPVTEPGEESKDQKNRLTNFRWIIQGGGEVSLKLWFHAPSPGVFKETLNFEVLGTKRFYQVHCRGVCAYPTISKEPKIVFSHCKKTLLPSNIVRKTYVLKSNTYNFGPLLCGMNREWHKEKHVPENMERLIIHNSSPTEAEVHFCFQHDNKATTFVLEPISMRLLSNQNQELRVWAFPTTPGLREDAVVCCIKDNPEPVIFPISCCGVQPELQLEHKQVCFDKTLLNRKVSKSLCLRNNVLLPVAWSLNGLDLLGEELTVSQDKGIIPPMSDLRVVFHFKARKPINLRNKIRLEVMDAENLFGTVQTENILISAEAYDVAIDVTFPKASNVSSTESFLDFGTVKVSDEVKLTLSLKNKGKYEASFRFFLDPCVPDIKSMFTITPETGTLLPNSHTTLIQLVFCHHKEVYICQIPIISLQVIEPNVTEGGEVIAIMPIKVFVQSFYSKFSIVPSRNINFGPLTYGISQTSTFTIENTGIFDLRYSLSWMAKGSLVPVAKKRLGHAIRTRPQTNHSARTASGSKLRHKDFLHKESGGVAQTTITVGVFSVSPASGIVATGAHQEITVECLADQVGSWNECLIVDVDERDPADHPDGIPYNLLAEVCVPAIQHNNIASIFEEHHICKNNTMLSCKPYSDAPGVYVQDENKFIFNNVIVGHSAQARFRITNPGKVPCMLSFALKPVSNKASIRTSDVFQLTPSRMCIPSSSHIFVVVTFSPLTMQMYQAVFEANVDKLPSMMPVVKIDSLTFNVVGEGNLPRVVVIRPMLKNLEGNPLLKFRRLQVGHSQKLSLVLKNDSIIPAQISINLHDEEEVFNINALPITTLGILATQTEAVMCTGISEHKISLLLDVEQQAELEVQFQPARDLRFEASLQVQVLDNPFETTVVQLIGEGYCDIITFDNIGDKSVHEQDETQEYKSDLNFGDCHVGHSYQQAFTMTNHSTSDVLRFEWPEEYPQLKFFPRVGHLHAGCTKVITITFHSDQPVQLEGQSVTCKLSRVVFKEPVDQVSDWDDCLKTIKWIHNGNIPGLTKKDIVTDPEPNHSIVEHSYREMELWVSALCDFASFTCDTDSIHFSDTLLYQTQVFQFQMTNTSTVAVEFSWNVVMENKVVTPTSSHGTGMASATSLDSLLKFLSVKPNLTPFMLEPSTGNISPGNSLAFQVRFTPVRVSEYEARLVCSIPNLKGEPGPVIKVVGRSLLPYCHFHIEESNYLSSGRRNSQLRGPRDSSPLDPNTKVIEFASVGIETPISRVFSIVNPSSKSYSFTWKCEDGSSPSFKCLTPKGSVRSGKRAEISFEFTAQELGLVESFWSFVIPEQNLCVPFLLVGTSREPLVYLEQAHLNMGNLFMGHQSQKTIHIVNGEDIPFHFSFRDSSLHSESLCESLVLNCMSGSVPAHDRFPLVLSITPSHEGSTTFNLLCNVSGKLEPLTLNVKAEIFRSNAYVQCHDPNGESVELVPGKLHEVDFKTVVISNMTSCQFLISNPGKFSLNFNCKLQGPQQQLAYLSVDPQESTVAAGKQSSCTVSFQPSAACVLKNIAFYIRIKHGPTFQCSISGCGVPCHVHFSFLKHDFGIKFLHCSGMDPPSKMLIVSNTREQVVRLECLFSSKPHLEVGFQTGVLPPGQMVAVPITFYPQDAVCYKETIVFSINGCANKAVEIFGQGIELKIELENPKQKVVNLGALQIGQKTKTMIPVVNNSKAPLTFNWLMSSSLSALVHLRVFSLNPAEEVTLNACGGRCLVEAIFAPREHMAPFTEKLQIDCLGRVCPLLVLQGSCSGTEVNLDQTYLHFGAVVKGCRAVRCITMRNTGDIGVRFKWDVKMFDPDCNISPAEGSILPGMVVPLEVTFAPVELSQDIQYNLLCSIEGARPIYLSIAGSCIVTPVNTEGVNFVCQVRTQQTQTINLSNPSNERWVLKATLQGEHWSAAPTFVIEPNQHNKPYEVTYKPLVMTTDGKKHQGSVFFMFPDGTGMLYALLGTSEPPKAAANISRELPCKMSHTELLLVKNWLSKPQSFHVIMEILKPERPDNTVSLKGSDYIDIPALDTVNFSVSFYTYKEGTYNTKVTFRNEATQEYEFYNLNFKATAPNIICTIQLETTVRRTSWASVELENPLCVGVILSTECKCVDVIVPPQLYVPANSAAVLPLEYQPLRTGENRVHLTLHSSELGHFPFELELRALPAPPEKPLHFQVPLGSGQYALARFTSYSRVKAEYSCKTDCSDFTVEKNVSVAAGTHAGTEASVDVYFEPCRLGEIRSFLTISSPSGGEYVFPLIAVCLIPKAQGPFSIRSGSSVSIPFKNVFLQSMPFSFRVNNPAFTVNAAETIRAKKTHNIVVSFQSPAPAPQGPVNAKLTVSCPQSEGLSQNVSWVYYLRGFSTEHSQRKSP